MYVLALDQGTTSSRAIVFDAAGNAVASQAHEFKQSYPEPGWVEHDPHEIWDSQLRAARGALARAQIRADDIAALGITNQRETTVVWERATGRPIYPAIVWQSRQTVELCEELRRRGLEPVVRDRTGLVIDAYFSATKLAWILSRVDGARDAARRGELAFGTIDSWLVYKLTGGKVHATDYSIVRDSSGVFGTTAPELLGAAIPIAGVAGDQQAALFGQTCFEVGSAKNTYGTGCFLLMNTGRTLRRSASGLISTIAWGVGGQVEYALEGAVFVAGAAVQWLRDELGLLHSAAESEALARSVPDAGGVYVVPAFTGLGAPYWDPNARGTIVGITRGTSRAHLVRATLEAIAFESVDLLRCFERDTEVRTSQLQVDGGATANDFLMQFQADVMGVPVRRPKVLETTALGAAYLAGLATGFWKDRRQIAKNWQEDRYFEPAISEAKREELYRGWQRAVERARGWIPSA